MVMKDKLVKYNKKGNYFRIRKIVVALVLVIGGLITISVPTYISINNAMLKTNTPNTAMINSKATNN